MLKNRKRTEEVLKNLENIRERFRAITEESDLNISELKELEKERIALEIELHEAYEYADSILQTINEALIILDDKLTVIAVNKAFYSIFYVSEKETLNRKIYDIEHRQLDIPEVKKLLEDIIPFNSEFSNYEIEYNFPIIGNRTLRLNARRVDYGLSKTRMILLAIEDVTQQIATLKYMNIQAAQKEATNKELEAIVYSIAHDLRAPLRSINGFVSILGEKFSALKSDPETVNYIERIKTSTINIDDMLETMKYFLNIIKKDLKRESINLSKMVEEHYLNHHKTDPERTGEIIIQPDLIIKADRDLIQTIIYHLINNAWNFTRKKDPYRIEFGKKLIKEENVYFIKDNGIGFLESESTKIFRPFFKLHQSTAEDRGYGVGLAMVQAAINKQLGKVWAEGKPNQGATFYFTMGNA